MKTHRLQEEIWLPRPLPEVFRFFSDARNLGVLTPPELHFKIMTRGNIKMEEGTLIDYRFRVYGMPVWWRSRIAAWETHRRFVDEQVHGPYRMWRHEHLFIERNGGTVVRDEVRYAVWGGECLHRWLVRDALTEIFNYRKVKIQELMGSPARD